MALRLNGSRYLLTWPQSGALTHRIIKRHLKAIKPIRYLVISKELHENGGEHFHAVVLYNSRICYRRNVFTIDEFVCNIQKIGKTNTSLKRSIAYVKKDGEFQEWGEIPACCTKLDKREKVMYVADHTNKECAQSGYFNFSELRALDYIRSLWQPMWPQWKKRKVWWFYGRTGTGKTRTAWNILNDAYPETDIWCSSGKLDPFFIGYSGQRAALLDDFRPGTLRFELLLRILDGYPVWVNVKNGQVQWQAEIIIITAPTRPNDMYVNRETGQEWDNLDQLLRRIDETREFDHFIDGDTTEEGEFVSD